MQNAYKGANRKLGMDASSLPSGRITRLKAKQFKKTLNGLTYENFGKFGNEEEQEANYISSSWSSWQHKETWSNKP